MMISRTELHNVVNAYLRRASNQGPKTHNQNDSPANKTDSISVSDRALELSRLREELAQLSELRTDRVRELKEQISAGTYEVSAEQIADKILERVVADQLAGAAESE